MTTQKPTGRDTVRQKLEALTIFPLANLGLIQGKTWRPFFTEITGLSVGRIAQGNIDKIRPSTLKRVQENVTAWAYEQGKKRGWTTEDLSAQMAAVPKKLDGKVGSWASWIKSMEIPDLMYLPLTIALALKADELFQSLIDACNQDDIERFKCDVCTHHGSINRTILIDTAESDTKRLSGDPKWAAISNWDEIGAILMSQLESILLDIYTSLDAEWGNQYFQATNPVPFFLWIAPRINENWDIQLGPIPSKNMIHRPVRRLLELSYAVAHRHYRKRWPSAAVGRSELGKALQLSDTHVGNYFDGTRKLSLSTYTTYWEVMCQHLSSARDKSKSGLRCPTPLAVMAITLQEMLIVNTNENKLKSFTLLSEDDYKRRWECHRRNLVIPSSSVDVEWPVWLLNQSVSSDSFRSFQSSGLSSSPRECQYSS
ncbi:hypothetical protein MIZ03_3153 [Rhodoferax lithotrophicus]|uniref:Integrase n=1 Tax=Rhodoferax lithotrophicus TaxID=2798804 RepID=A0ABN6DDY1_9BURK|nr:hypothetical protein [Rhodoferax sp. MIZ03]BCO28253.1 hypothetical protein MIZ03_3153 [Rhodoferax sp. MIZ03]